MVAIVPSQIVDYVNTIFDLQTWFTGAELHLGNESALAATVGLLDLLEKVPSYLITVNREDSARLISNVAAVKAAIYRAQNLEVRERQLGGLPTLKPMGAGQENPVIVVRDVMAKCGDEAIRPKTPELPFLTDPDLRATLQGDISQAYAGLEGSHWKTTTVLGGSVLEALLV